MTGVQTCALPISQLVRRKLIVKTFRLAGRAPLPSIHKFEDDAI